MPRWTIHCAVCRDAACRGLPRTARLPFLGCAAFLQIEHNVLARAMHSHDPLALERRGDDAGRRLERLLPEPIQTDSMVSPATRRSRPRTMVSTSGSSGTLSGYKMARRRALLAFQLFAISSEPRAKQRFPGLLLHSPIRYARAYTPSSAGLPSFPVFSAAAAQASVCDPGAGFGLRPRNNSKWSFH